MRNLLADLFGGSTRAASPKRTLESGRDNPLTIEDGSDNATRRQLIQVLLRDFMRRHGIPMQWLECQVQPVSSRSRGSGMYVRLVVRQWDDRLMHYTHAFQSELMTEITRFDPQAAQWLHGISWQLEVADTCPHRTMPEKAYWADPPKQTGAPLQESRRSPLLQTPQARSALHATPDGPDSDTMKDLEHLFRIRDEELGKQGDADPAAGYEPTQPSPL